MADSQPSFLRVPIDIRLAVYAYLFAGGGQKVFEIRNQDPEVYKRRPAQWRKQYRVLGRDLMRQSKPTTYHLVTDVELHPAIMAVNSQIYEETAHIIYGNSCFSFGRDIEAIVPFFNDLSKATRPFIHGISLTKQGAVYTRDFDRCQWSNTCRFLRDEMHLRSLKMVIEGGRPSIGWEGLPEFTAKEFKTLQRVTYDHLEWVWELLTIKGVQHVEIYSEIHHCPPAHSSAMAFFAAFSASIETGFADFLRAQMIAGVQ